ncbi:MAG: hypothetical protein R3A13_06500 [Bdellovibrionota bacterium]
MNLQNLTDDELLTNAKRFANEERNAMADLLVYLAEINKRKIYLEHGYSSIESFLIRKLKIGSNLLVREVTHNLKHLSYQQPPAVVEKSIT